MKKILLGLLMLVLFNSCATILGGSIQPCQRTKPKPTEATRKIRVGALVADILLFWPGAIVDFYTGAIYVPCEK